VRKNAYESACVVTLLKMQEQNGVCRNQVGNDNVNAGVRAAVTCARQPGAAACGNKRVTPSKAYKLRAESRESREEAVRHAGAVKSTVRNGDRVAIRRRK